MGILKSYNESNLIDKRFGPGQNPDSSLPRFIESKIDDTARISKLMASKQGVKFIANNALLQKEQIRNTLSNSAGGNLFQRVKTAAVDQFKNATQLVASTLAQVPVNGTGTHFVHKFRTDTYLQPAQGDVEPTALQGFLGRGGVEGAQTVLAGGTVEGQVEERLVKVKTFKTPQKYTQTQYYRDNNISQKFKIGYAVSGSINPVDEINLSDTTGITSREHSDLAVLRFQVIYPEQDKVENIQFRSYITSFSDNFSGNWAGYQYMGRGENFYTYQGFDRGISLGFKIFAQTGKEMKPLYKKMQLLASTTAPTYSPQGLMRGTLVKMTVGGYLTSTPGFIESVNFTVSQDDQWDIGSAFTDDLSLPMSLDCSVSFKPIHGFIPQTGTTDQFIAEGLGQEVPLPNDRTVVPTTTQEMVPISTITAPPDDINSIRIPV